MRQSTFNNAMRAFITIILCAWSLAYLWHLTFTPNEHLISKYAGEILGFTLGTSISTLLAFYFNVDKGTDKRRKTDYEQPAENGNGEGEKTG